MEAVEPETLASLETLELFATQLRPELVAWLDRHPRLRTVIWPRFSIFQQRAAAERLPHLQTIGAHASRLRERWWPRAHDFDLLAPSNWPKC